VQVLSVHFQGGRRRRSTRGPCRRHTHARTNAPAHDGRGGGNTVTATARSGVLGLVSAASRWSTGRAPASVLAARQPINTRFPRSWWWYSQIPLIASQKIDSKLIYIFSS